MVIKSDDVAQKLADYLRRRLSLDQLVDWAENVMLEAEFDDNDAETIRPIVARLGLADVKEFGITWDDFYSFLTQLGYQVNVIIARAA